MILNLTNKDPFAIFATAKGIEEMGDFDNLNKHLAKNSAGTTIQRYSKKQELRTSKRKTRLNHLTTFFSHSVFCYLRDFPILYHLVFFLP